MNNTTTKTFTVAAVIAIAAFASGCAATAQQGPGFAPRHGDLALAVPVDAAQGNVEVVVTGTDMSSPVFSQLQIEDGVARGMVYDVNEGEGRRVLIVATAADGRRCAREINTNVEASTVNAIEAETLRCEALHTASPQAIARAERERRQSYNDFPPVL